MSALSKCFIEFDVIIIATEIEIRIEIKIRSSIRIRNSVSGYIRIGINIELRMILVYF